MRKKRKAGRPPREVPRKSCHVYMTDNVIATIEKYQTEQVLHGKSTSFSDAIEGLVEIAAQTMVEARLKPCDEVFGAMPPEIPTWIDVDGINGKRVRCLVCRESHDITGRFDTRLHEIGVFVKAHGECDASTEKTGT